MYSKNRTSFDTKAYYIDRFILHKHYYYSFYYYYHRLWYCFFDCSLRSFLVGKAEKNWLRELQERKLRNKKPRLWKALVAIIPWRSIMTMLTLQVLRSLSFSLLPLCLWLLLKVLNDVPELNMKLAFSYVALLGAMSVVQAGTTQHYDYLTELWGLKLKVALTGLVYKKVRSFIV